VKPRPSPGSSLAARLYFTLSPRAADILTILFLLLLPPLFFWRETLGWLTLGDQDALFWFFPIYKLVAEQILAGHLPLWNPYVYSGLPLLAQPQAGVFDPINWIYLLGATSRTLTLAQELSFAIALLAAYGYARSLGWKRRACVVTAVGYAFSGFAAARTIYPGLLHILALTPLPLFFIERIYQSDSRGKWRAVVCGSLIVAWQIFAGHPQPFIYSSLLAGSYALFCAFFREQSRGVSAERQTRSFAPFRFLFRCAVMYVAGIALSAVELLPAIEFARQSVRREWTYEMFTAHSLHPVSLLTALFPYFHGSGKGIYHLPFWGSYWHHNEAQIYLGALALALAITGFFCAWRMSFRTGIFWGLVAAVAVLLSLGKYVPPLARVIYQIPALNGFRSPNRHWMEVTLAVAVLAGYGVECLLRRTEEREAKGDPSSAVRRVAKIAAATIALFCAAIGSFALLHRETTEAAIRHLPDLQYLSDGFLKQAGAEFYLPIIAATVAWLTMIIVTRAHQPHRWYPLLLLLLTDLNLYALFAPINSRQKPESVIGQAIPIEIRAGRNPYEMPRYHEALPGNAAGDFSPAWFYGHEMATGYDPLMNARYKTFSGIDEAGHTYISSLFEAKDQTLDLLSVQYILVPKNLPEPAGIQAVLNETARWRRVTDVAEGRYEVYENLRALPRAWLTERIEAAYEGDQLKIVRGELPDAGWRDFDPRRVALVEPETARKLASHFSAANQTDLQSEIISISRVNPHVVEVSVNAVRPAMVVLSEIAFPGWQAEIDGVRTDVCRVNYALSGIAIQPGRHRLRLIYRPKSLMIGAVLSLTTLLLLLLVYSQPQRHPIHQVRPE
jgi:hypothetical protein